MSQNKQFPQGPIIDLATGNLSLEWFMFLQNAIIAEINGTIPASAFPALSGDITTSPGSLATTLKNTGTAGVYTKTTFDAQGREISGTSAILASSDFANQGTAITVLHGNSAGNPSFGLVALGTDVSGSLPNTSVSGLGTMSTQNANAVSISGGAVDGTTVGATTSTTVKGTTITATTGLISALITASGATPVDIAMAVNFLFQKGTNNALRLNLNADATGIELASTDSTGSVAFKPMLVNGSVVNLQIGGTTKLGIDASGNTTLSGTIKPPAGGYLASDGTVGLTQGSTTTLGKSITLKDGLVVAFA